MIDLERGGSINGVVDALNHILDIAFPGLPARRRHADRSRARTLCDSADVAYYRDMVTIMRDRVQDMIKKGMTLEQVKAAKPTRDYDPRYGSTQARGRPTCSWRPCTRASAPGSSEPSRCTGRRFSACRVARRSRCAAMAAGAQRGPQSRAETAAPVDLTGYWVSVVTEDWRYRMVTPAQGDHPSVPLNAAGNALANSWDPAKDEAAGEQCKAYGAAGVMRVPGRLHVTWQDDATLKIETEAGPRRGCCGSVRRARRRLTRRQLQGNSAAQWEFAGGARAAAAARRAPPAPGGNLKVVTTRMRPGYLQKNGVPYSGNAVLTEYFSRTIEPNGDSWLILTSIVDDPQYLTGPFIRSTHYKKLPDTNTAWEPEPCSAR